VDGKFLSRVTLSIKAILLSQGPYLNGYKFLKIQGGSIKFLIDKKAHGL